jgi:hypothetical protein
MAEAGIPGPVASVLREVMDAWVHRNEREAAQKAGSLTFWRDGMLQQLRAIGDGKATTETFDELKTNFKKTEKSVNHAMARLRRLRDQLAGTALGAQIDMVLSAERYGKAFLRDMIGDLIKLHDDNVEIDKEWVREICGGIELFNSELMRLHRLAYPSS